VRRLLAWYGASPVHLAALVIGGALSAYAVSLVPSSQLLAITLWFAGMLLVHDLVLFPIYAAADNAAAWLSHHTKARPPQVPWVNHVRVPAVLAGLLLVAWFPLILRLASPTYEAATGLSDRPYLGRWLLVTAVLFVGSALLYVGRTLNAARRRAAEHGGLSRAEQPRATAGGEAGS